MIKVTSKNGNPVPDKPNMLHKAWNLTKSIVEYAKSGFENTAKDKYEERLIICDTCELLNKKKGTCKVCGCVMSVKAKWNIEKCPEGKW